MSVLPRSALLAGVLLTTTGCATIMSGTHQEVPVNVQPAGAIVCVDGTDVGRAPLTVDLKRKEAHVLMLEKDGYRPEVFLVGTAPNPWTVFNVYPLILLPGPIGVLVDALTGAVYDMYPARVYVALEELDSIPAVLRNREPCTPIP
jgi:hypothetical protein